MKQKKQKSKFTTFINCLIKTVNEYISVSSITGLKYVQSERSTAVKWEFQFRKVNHETFKIVPFVFRIFWSLVICLSFIFCNILVAHFWLRYKSNSTRMVVASNHIPIASLKLPAITLCPIGHIHSGRLEAFVDKM